MSEPILNAGICTRDKMFDNFSSAFWSHFVLKRAK